MGVGIHRALLGGAKYLGANQLPDGGYISHSTSRDSSDMRTYHTVFFPSLILSSLADIDLPGLTATTQKLINFLLTQKNEHWSYNYWVRTSPEFSSIPYPDDLDDTFCALAALTKTRPDLFDGKVLGAVTQLLIDTESQEGGPYRTWLVDAQAGKIWQDVDVAVNANVAYFLSLHDVVLPNIEQFIDTAIQQNKLSSPYYPNIFPIAYFISRWYRGEQLQTLLSIIRKRKHSTPQQAALKLMTLLHGGDADDDSKLLVDYVLKAQNPDGSWPADAFCLDPTTGGKTHYASSPSLATVLCMAALHMYQRSIKANPETASAPRPQNDLYDQVVVEAKRRIATLKSPELRDNTAAMLTDILGHDNDKQIILLPQMTAHVFGLATDRQLLMQLAMVNLWGWMAYTIYDDFLDGEGRPSLLPSANVALRQLTAILGAIMPRNQVFHTEVTDILNRLDGANAWEVTHCRGVLKRGRLYITELPDYTDYWQLAERSLGHTIAGLGVLYAAHVPDQTVDALKQFFTQYLIARQLNDDAHDWQQDLSHGHVNAVGVRILRRWQADRGSLEQGIDLKQEAENLNLIMWEHVIQEASADIDAHIASARQALKAFPQGSKTESFDRLLTPLERSARRALDERNNAIGFIDSLDS